jgi:hypothetical protein
MKSINQREEEIKMKIEFFGKWFSVISINFFDDQVCIIYQGVDDKKMIQMHLKEWESMGKKL